MNNIYEFIERCLKYLKNPENEERTIEILEGLNTDLILDGVEPPIRVAQELEEIGETDIMETFIYPIIADLDTKN
ncbi:hypothetical protein KQI68_06680 [Peptoniphilus sp. MSJ-1]|uniref:Uncharacterized protein n=1 Tax=Peptoniphilus ovalis TaxID=2841503 RepID=A0ABS6FJA9_9FIRM|nr:hypothetical protein [Peptoniphilus ovalis]MBU5669523.1 hypothetical protein [Peptoniphilus ovalis]